MICEYFAANTSLLCLCQLANNATQAVELRGPDICSPVPEARLRLCDPNGPPLPTSNDDTAAMSEVSSILTAACEAHRLPLAQAWVRCKRCNTNSLTAAGAPFHLAGRARLPRGLRRAAPARRPRRAGPRGGHGARRASLLRRRHQVLHGRVPARAPRAVQRPASPCARSCGAAPAKPACWSSSSRRTAETTRPRRPSLQRSGHVSATAT
jgi:hypothetical protein